LSTWGIDVIYYGMNLADYIDKEFNPTDDDPNDDDSLQSPPRPQCPETFWTQLADWNADGCPFPAV
jgi:hypothetical protein